jgi:hypothetical protein
MNDRKYKTKKEPIIYKINYRSNNKIKSIYQYIDNNNNEKNNTCFIPFWLIIMFCYLFIFILIILAASLYVNFSKRPGLYTESCSERSCMKTLNMKCINKQCLCLSTQYYIKGCVAKKGYLEKCHGNTSYCIDNLNFICIDGLCKCSKSSYWNDTMCVLKSNYNTSCRNDEACFTDSQIVCDSITKKCLCSSDRYFVRIIFVLLFFARIYFYRFWDGYACWVKRTYNEACLNASQCRSNENLSCLNGLCKYLIKEI